MIDQIELNGFGRQICRKDKEHTRLIPAFNMVHFVEDGYGYFNGRRLTKGQGFICFSDRLCHYMPDTLQPWTYSWINVSGSGAQALLKRIPNEDGVFTFDPVDNRQLIESIVRRSSPESDEMRCIGILLTLCSGMIDGKKEDYVTKAERLLRNNYHNGITVGDVAAQINVSRAYLRNMFVKAKGISPQQFLMNVRMERAEELLRREHTVSEIALATGYSDVLQFSRIFFKYHGMSPSAYRKMIKADIQPE